MRGFTSTRFIHAGSMIAGDTIFALTNRFGMDQADFGAHGVKVLSARQLPDQDQADPMDDTTLVIPTTYVVVDEDMNRVAFTVISGRQAAEVAV